MAGMVVEPGHNQRGLHLAARLRQRSCAIASSPIENDLARTSQKRQSTGADSKAVTDLLLCESARRVRPSGWPYSATQRATNPAKSCRTASAPPLRGEPDGMRTDSRQFRCAGIFSLGVPLQRTVLRCRPASDSNRSRLRGTSVGARSCSHVSTGRATLSTSSSHQLI